MSPIQAERQWFEKHPSQTIAATTGPTRSTSRRRPRGTPRCASPRAEDAHGTLHQNAWSRVRTQFADPSSLPLQLGQLGLVDFGIEMPPLSTRSSPPQGRAMAFVCSRRRGRLRLLPRAGNQLDATAVATVENRRPTRLSVANTIIARPCGRATPERSDRMCWIVDAGRGDEAAEDVGSHARGSRDRHGRNSDTGHLRNDAEGAGKQRRRASSDYRATAIPTRGRGVLAGHPPTIQVEPARTMQSPLRARSPVGPLGSRAAMRRSHRAVAAVNPPTAVNAGCLKEVQLRHAGVPLRWPPPRSPPRAPRSPPLPRPFRSA